MKKTMLTSLKYMAGIITIVFASAANAVTFDLTPGSFDGGIAGGTAYDSLNATSGGIGLTLKAFTIVNDGSGVISSKTQITGTETVTDPFGGTPVTVELGVYVSGSANNIGVRSNADDGSNLDGGSSASDPDEGILFSFDQQVSLDFINFDSFFDDQADDFNLTVDGVSVLVDYNLNNTFSDTSSSVTNAGLFDEYFFNNIVGTEFLIWADGNSDAFRINSIEVSAVPVPAAAWLFGSALLGMFGFSRRKKA